MLPQRKTRSKHLEETFCHHLKVAFELACAQSVQEIISNSMPLNFVRYVTSYVKNDYSCDCDACLCKSFPSKQK